jgi:hypothetical protein
MPRCAACLDAEFARAHKLVTFDRCRDAHVARMFGAAAQDASQAAHADRARLRELVRQSHDDFDRSTAPKSFREMEIESARTHFPRFGESFSHNKFVRPTDGERQTH